MPVNVLYCEGDDKKSIDANILKKIVPANCFIKPIGSKHGFLHRIVGAREAQPHKCVAGIKDRDFDDDDSTPTNTPHEWYATVNNKQVLLGWYWERKEIENYLIDPVVVKPALGAKAPPLDEYKAALQKSAKMIANYTAARMALSGISYPNLPFNYWGEERELGYFFPKDKGLKEPDCRSQISRIMADKKREMEASKVNILDKFDQLLEDCGVGGKRFEHYLTAGKDLLYMMRHDLKRFGFKDSQQPACYTFRDAILRGIRYSPADVWTWLPEWQRLRELLQTTNPLN
jgi:hypothetical protein